MRILFLFSVGFAAACLLSVYILPVWVAATLGAAFAAVGGVLTLLQRKNARRAAVLLLGLAVGLCWCIGYRAIFYQPAVHADGAALTVCATVADYPEQTDYGAAVTARALLDGRRVKVRLYLDDAATTLRPGDELTATATLRLSAEDTEPLMSRWYDNANGVYLTGAATQWSFVRPEKTPLSAWPRIWNYFLQEKLKQIFPADVSGFFTALLTGSKNGLSAQHKADLTRAGVYHTVAISGMHVGLLLGLVLLLTRKRRVLACAVGVPIMLLFIALIGGTPGVTRAGLLSIFLLLAPVLKKEADAPTSFGAALLLLLAENPFACANIGLQLSFGAVAGIGLLGGKLSRWFARKIEKLPARYLKRIAWFIASSISVTLGALLFTVPISALQYGTVCLISPLSNLLILWAVSLGFTLGAAAAALGCLCLPLGQLLGAAAAWPARYVLWMSGLLAKIPFATVYTAAGFLGLWLVFAYVLVALCLILRGIRHPLIPACCGVLSLGVCLLLTVLPSGTTSFSFSALDVGQGQCLAVCAGGASAIIDCGGDSASGAATAAEALLQETGGLGLDVLVLTHYDIDHCGGAERLLYDVQTQLVLLPDVEDAYGRRARVEAAAAATGAAVRYVTADTTLQFGSGTMQVFSPLSDETENDASLAVLCTFGSYDMLVTGDMDLQTEALLTQTHDLPDIELLVAGHHGSKYATGETLLRDTKPETVLISVGENNYGHPAAQTIERIRRAGATIFRTDQCGTITIRS
ncbi:MAG: DNA internalization-related competence protein ComEC/Rec2 [Oscillospiraceae bacterium]|nr:DNA internalization-related competence protein ComEC/Rec2 [Oscillospiraceae bacterium]